MYGFVHCCLEDLVLKLFGEEKWQEILEECSLVDDSSSFIIHRIYTDEESFALVGACCKILGLNLNECLEAFGTHFLHYCQGSGYDRLLKVLGGRLEDFLTNLDYLHEHLASIYPGIHTPSFRCTRSTDGALLLHYYSDRKGLQSIVKGLVKTISLEFFNSLVTIEEVDKDDKDEHIILKIVEDKKEKKAEESKLFREVEESDNPNDLQMNVASFCQAFPFHVVFTEDLYITQVGQSLKRLLKHIWSVKRVGFLELFLINRPHVDAANYTAIHKNQNATFVCVTLPGILNPQRPDLSIKLKGQMVPVPESQSMLFLCSPRVAGLDEMQEVGIYLSDFRVNDFTRDLILMKTARRGERELLENLEETTNQLKVAELQLKIDQKRTDNLLHSILPHKVAARLRLNLPVPAEMFDIVTFLFSDIVGFTAMCSSDVVKPMDIVRVLNKMYTLFDTLSTMNSVYKVETIGDAYMVVGGIPEFVETHADQVVYMGLGMLAAIQQVLSPVDGQPLKMRVGIHTGSALAGVVGQQMPRYCLFGNAVTLANKMESNSQPGKINISEESISHLTKKGYSFEENPMENFPLRGFFVTRPGENFDLNLNDEVAEIAEEEYQPEEASESENRNSNPEINQEITICKAPLQGSKSVDTSLVTLSGASDPHPRPGTEIPIAVIHPAPSVEKSLNDTTLQCPLQSLREMSSSRKSNENPRRHLDNSKLLQLFASAMCGRKHSEGESNNPIALRDKVELRTTAGVHSDRRKHEVPLVEKSNFLCKFQGKPKSLAQCPITLESKSQESKK